MCVCILASRCLCWMLGRWKKNWTIHLDGYFQTNSRNDRGDLVKVARGIRRLSILDTKANDEDGSIGAQTHPTSLYHNEKILSNSAPSTSCMKIRIYVRPTFA